MTNFKKESNVPLPDFDILVAATFYMLTRCSKEGSQQMTQKIVEHLMMLLEQPQVKGSMVLRSSITGLLSEWKEQARISGIESESGLLKTLATNH
jgi:hypothetical protein